MYATIEDHEYLLGVGFTDDGGAAHFARRVGDQHQIISPTWEGMKMGSVSPPTEEDVYWSAVSVGTTNNWGVTMVVRFEDRQPTPTAAFVLAEVRGWKP